jgi:hypothetical protein
MVIVLKLALLVLEWDIYTDSTKGSASSGAGKNEECFPFRTVNSGYERKYRFVAYLQN